MFTGYIHGIEKIWIIGDEFANNTVHPFYRSHKKNDSPTTYAYTYYEVKEFTTARNSVNTKNILSRLRNGLITALNEHNSLPRLIVMVVDDDIITSLPARQHQSTDRTSLTNSYEHILSNLCKMLEIAIDCYKDMLPPKAKRDKFPHILWIAPPTHKFFSERNNEKRVKFTTALSTVVAIQRNMSMLKLVKHWNHDDGNLFLEQQYRYTTEGLNKYWASVDASIKFWDVAIVKKFEKPAKKTDGKSIVSQATGSTYPHQETKTLDSNSTPSDTRRGQDGNESTPNNYNYRHRQREDYDYGSRYPRHKEHSHYQDYSDNYNYEEWKDSYRNRNDYYDQRSNYKWSNRDYKKSSRRLPY